MIIDTIAATALKGQTFKHTLGALTMICGPNDTGKTARIECPVLAWNGYLPRHGKPAKSTFGLSSEAEMSVEITSAGRTIRRTWNQANKGIKTKAAGTEGLEEMPLVMLDAREFCGRTSAAQVNMLFDVLRIDPMEWTPEILQASIAKTGTVADFLTLTVPAAGETVQAWIERAAEVVEAEAATARATIARMLQTQQGLTKLALTEQPVDGAQVERLVAIASKQLEELIGEQGRLNLIVSAQAEQAEKVAELNSRLTRITEELGERPISTRPDLALLAEMETARNERARFLTIYDQASLKAADGARAAARAEKLNSEIAAQLKISSGLDAATAALTRLKAELAAIPVPEVESKNDAFNGAEKAKAGAISEQESIDRQREAAKKEHTELMQLACCPTCQANGTGWRAALARKHAAAMLELDTRAAQVAGVFAIASGNSTTAGKELAEAKAAEKSRQSIERKIGETQLELQKAEAAGAAVIAKRAELELIGDTSGTPPVKPPEIATLTAQIADLSDQVTRRRIARDKAELEREIAEVTIDGDEDSGQRLANLEDAIEAARDRLKELEPLTQRAANQKADERRLAEAREEQAAAESRLDLLTATAKTVKLKKAELIKTAFAPLLETVNTFTAGILPSPLEYVAGELGRFSGASWIAIDYFGGTHEAAAFAGIQAALGVRSPARVVLVDEITVMEPANKLQFLRNVRRALDAGKMDQFIGVDWSAELYREHASELDLTLITTSQE